MRLIITSLLIACTSGYVAVRTPITAAFTKDYIKGLGPDFDVVAHGGYYKLEKEAAAKLGAANFASLKPYLPNDFNVVDSGGWNKVYQLAADPKGLLTSIVRDGLKSKRGKVQARKGTGSREDVVTLAGLLHAHGKGYDGDLVDGAWASVLNLQAKKSPRIQKIVGVGERAGTSYFNFHVDDLAFDGSVKLIFGKGDLKSKVKYNPVADNFSVVDKRIVLRRIACDIVGASWKFWKLPRVPLPLRKKGGYLDFLYLDKDLRVTKGNRGGVFVHFRPEFLEKVMAS